MRYALLAMLCLLPIGAHADPKGLEPLPESAQPPVVGAEESPSVTITQKGEEKIEEYRLHGQLYMIKVTPAHGRPYYLVDLKGDGKFVRQAPMDSAIRPPMWVIHRF